MFLVNHYSWFLMMFLVNHYFMKMRRFYPTRWCLNMRTRPFFSLGPSRQIIMMLSTTFRMNRLKLCQQIYTMAISIMWNGSTMSTNFDYVNNLLKGFRIQNKVWVNQCISTHLASAISKVCRGDQETFAQLVCQFRSTWKRKDVAFICYIVFFLICLPVMSCI